MPCRRPRWPELVPFCQTLCSSSRFICLACPSVVSCRASDILLCRTSRACPRRRQRVIAHPRRRRPYVDEREDDDASRMATPKWRFKADARLSPLQHDHMFSAPIFNPVTQLRHHFALVHAWTIVATFGPGGLGSSYPCGVPGCCLARPNSVASLARPSCAGLTSRRASLGSSVLVGRRRFTVTL